MKNYSKIVMMLLVSFFLTGVLYGTPPTDLTTSGSTSTYCVTAPAVVIDAGVTVANGPFTGGLVDITNFVSGDQLTYSPTLHGITGSFNATTGVLTLSGNNSASDYQDVFQSIQFSTSNSNTTTRTVSFQVGTALFIQVQGITINTYLPAVYIGMLQCQLQQAQLFTAGKVI
jgi:hypothetical protein